MNFLESIKERISPSLISPHPSTGVIEGNLPKSFIATAPIPSPEDELKFFKTIPIPEQFRPLILRAAKENNIHPALLAAQLFQESGIQVGRDNNDDRGIAQINRLAHPEINDQQAADPNFAIPFMAQQVSSGLKKFGDINRAVSSYNVGMGGASVKGRNPYGGGPKGQTYLNNVAKNLDPELVVRLGLKTGDVVE